MLYWHCNNCLKGPCRTVYRGSPGMTDCPLWRDSDRASWEQIEIFTEIRSPLTQACELGPIHDPDDLPHETMMKGEI